MVDRIPIIERRDRYGPVVGGSQGKNVEMTVIDARLPVSSSHPPPAPKYGLPKACAAATLGWPGPNAARPTAEPQTPENSIPGCRWVGHKHLRFQPVPVGSQVAR